MDSRIAAIAVTLCVVCSFGCGWAVNGWRLGEQISASAADAERQRTEAARWAMAEQERSAAAMRQADTQAQQRIAEKDEQLSAFERCIRDGHGCGLRVKVVTAACPGVPEAGGAAGVGGGSQQSAELADSVGPDYRALRTGIVRLEQALKVCVDAAERSH